MMINNFDCIISVCDRCEIIEDNDVLNPLWMLRAELSSNLSGASVS